MSHLQPGCQDGLLLFFLPWYYECSWLYSDKPLGIPRGLLLSFGSIIPAWGLFPGCRYSSSERPAEKLSRFPQCERHSWESLLVLETHTPHLSPSLFLSLSLSAWARTCTYLCMNRTKTANMHLRLPSQKHHCTSDRCGSTWLSRWISDMFQYH